MSDNYIVSARKYRPQTFDTVVGQEHITTTLKNAIKNKHLAHAYLFCGPRGVGKTTCARILAKTINCESPTAEMEACGSCSTCVTFKDSTSFNVFELDAASNNSVDDIRELTSQVRFAPQHGKFKVYIIDEVHMLSTSAFNAFLKTLEEPPPYAIFILATTEKHKILPTILSRCQIFDFKRITTGDITTHLQGIASKESMIANEAALHVIAQKSEGCMRDALSMLDRIASFTNGMLTYANTMEHLNLLDADFYFRLTDALLSQDVAGTLLLFDNALERGFEGDVILGGLAEHFRNLLLCKDSRMAKLLDVPGEHRQMYHEKANQAPPAYVISALNVINDSELQYKNATNRRLHVEMCLIRLCFLLQTVSGSSLNTGTMPDEKKNTSSVGIPLPPPTQVPPPQAVVPNHRVVEDDMVSYAAAPIPVITPQAPKPVVSASPITASEQNKPAAPSAPPSRKVSMNMLGDLEGAISRAATERAGKPREISLERANELFEQYKQELYNAGKGVIHSQFLMMKIEVPLADEVCVVSPHELTDTYAREQRNSMVDFYAQHSGMTIRVTNKIVEDKSLVPDEKRVLSKNEMYEVMVARNPNLARLKEGVGLHIEY